MTISAEIISKIYQNTSGAITGTVLQGVLLDMVAVLQTVQDGTMTPIAPVVTTLVTDHLAIKASAGSLYYVQCSSTVPGWLMLFDTTSVPVNGTVTPDFAVPVGSNTLGVLSFSGLPPASFATGIMAVFSSTGPFTLTKSSTAFITGAAI